MKLILTIISIALSASNWLAGQDEPTTESSEETPIATPVEDLGPKHFISDIPLVQTEIEAESLRAEITEEKGYLIGVGGVRMVATNLEITCNQIEVFTDVKDKDGNDTIGDISSINKIIAIGNVRIVQDQRSATAGLAEVYPNDDFILLDEDPILYQGDITIDGTGAQLKIYRGNGRVEWVGDPNNKIRISAPPLQDLGFEEDEETMVPVTAEPTTETAADPSNSEPKREEGNSKKPNRSESN
ncbi:MAG TPA: hypothetical protein DCS60_03575 [Opitutae bacterium]|nr:hypothetical protein [Opitutae bacterium]|tara:strand:+ start:615 stop:1343 length:729 start_codon:yes stop_codon:yes gene_type:complete